MASAVAPKPALSDTHPFTCNTCQVAFRSNDSQRTHYHTDWHQYNLKRKVAELPPLSSETFAEKVLHAQASTRLERERATFEKSCKACNKTYFSENAYANHVGSQKHRANVARAQMNAIRAGGSARVVPVAAKPVEDRDETGSVVSSTFSLGEPVSETPVVEKVAALSLKEEKEEEEKEAEKTETPETETPETEEKAEKKDELLPLEACLFCPYVSPNLTLNVSHMTKAHGLFIPEASYLTDLPGLISYLGRKLVLGNQCLYCNKTKGGLDGIRTHMQDKGHTMLGFETEAQQIELGQYYDFRSTYSDLDSDDESDSTPAPHLKSKTLVMSENPADWQDDEEEGEGWETDSDASSVDSRDLTSVPVDKDPKAASGERKHHMQDGWHSHAHHHVYHDEYELHLPSGRSVGHRSLARYYRQNLRDHPLSLTSREVRRQLANTPYPHHQNGDSEDVDMEDGGVLVHEPANRRERREGERARFQVALRNQGGLVGVDRFTKREVEIAGKRAQAEEHRGRRKQEWGVNKKGNSQKHFRDPLLQ